MKSLRFLCNFGVISIFLLISTGMRPLNPTVPSTVTIIVTTTADEWTDPGPETGCALREAIRAAGNHASFGGCTFSGSGEITIVVPAGTYTLTGYDLVVTTDVTINGVGWNATIIDGNNHTRIFYLNGSSGLTLNDMTLKNGRSMDGSDGANAANGENDQNGQDAEMADSGWPGGAIFSGDGPLVVNRVKFLNNAAGDGGDGGRGGDGGLRITPGTPTNGGEGGYGGAGAPGGAIYSDNAPVTITDCIFEGNHSGAGGDGGDGGNAGTPVAFSPAYPGDGGNGGTGNYGGWSGDGGAIAVRLGVLTINNSTFSGNYTPPSGSSGAGANGATGLNGTLLTQYSAGSGGSGGFSENGGHGGNGGAVSSQTALIVTNSTFNNNTAGAGGSGGSGGSAGNGGTGANNPGVSIPGCCKGGSGGNGGAGGYGGYGGKGGAIHSLHSITVTGSTFLIITPV